jgi:ribonuclease J
MSSSPSPLRVIPLGGLGEVGMNCLAIEHAEQILIIDCGMTFPADDYGVDVIHPRFDWLVSNARRIVGVCLTHGHEDHIGALPDLLREIQATVYGPRHALRLVERRLKECEMQDVTTLRELPLGSRTTIGAFEVEPIRMSHSIADATSLSIRCAAGHIVHSGDFKFDPAPSDGEVTDEDRLMQLGTEGVDLLLSDSTNIDSPGYSGSEADVEEALDVVIKAATGRVMVALFASNVQRLISLGRIARKRGRRLCLLGRSLACHVEVAKSLGYLDWPHGLIVPHERVRTYPHAELLILASGTQAEPGSAMARLAEGSHRVLDIVPGDTVVFSSRVIPGGERPVSKMIDDLLRRGAIVHGRDNRALHTSGHAHRDEQRHLIELLQPKCFIPVHGTLHHLKKHAQLAEQTGVPVTRVIENGQTMLLQDGRLERGADVPVGYVHVAVGGLVISEETLKARRDLGRYGVVNVSALCSKRGELQSGLALSSVGLPRFDVEPELRRELQDYVKARMGNAGSVTQLEQEITRLVRQWFERWHNQRPLVNVQLMIAQARASER